MKHISKMLLTILLVVVLIANTACTSTNNEVVIPSSTGETIVTEATEVPEVPVTITEEVIYDANDIMITVKGLYDQGFDTHVNLLIENNGNKNILITTPSLSVNGYMMDGSLYSTVAAGKKANTDISILNSDLEAAGIETITEIAFTFNLSDPETWDVIATSELINLKTSATDYVQEINDDGELLYEENGIRVICQGLKQNSVWDGTCVFYVENNSDRAVSIYAENVSVNGFMQEASFWVDLRPGTRIVDGMSLLDLEDIIVNSIDDIQTIEFNLKIIDMDTWEGIAVTNPFTLNFDTEEITEG